MKRQGNIEAIRQYGSCFIQVAKGKWGCKKSHATVESGDLTESPRGLGHPVRTRYLTRWSRLAEREQYFLQPSWPSTLLYQVFASAFTFFASHSYDYEEQTHTVTYQKLSSAKSGKKEENLLAYQKVNVLVACKILRGFINNSLD